MNNKKDRVLKYLADLMSQEEIHQFQSDLEMDNELKDLFISEKRKLDTISEKIDTDETYFVNILPEVREKIDQRKKTFWTGKNQLKVALPGLLAIVFLFSLFIKTENMDIFNKNIFPDSTEIDDFLNSDYIAIDKLLEDGNEIDYDLYELSRESDESDFIAFSSITEVPATLEPKVEYSDITEYELSEDEIKEILESIEI